MSNVIDFPCSDLRWTRGNTLRFICDLVAFGLFLGGILGGLILLYGLTAKL